MHSHHLFNLNGFYLKYWASAEDSFEERVLKLKQVSKTSILAKSQELEISSMVMLMGNFQTAKFGVFIPTFKTDLKAARLGRASTRLPPEYLPKESIS